MLNWFQTHGLEILIAELIYNSLVQAMPKPDEKCGNAYRFWYKLAHALAMNWRVVAKKAKIC